MTTEAIEPVDRPPFFAEEPEALSKLVKLVDPGLEFVSDLHPDASSCRTLLVTEAGQKYILKVRQVSRNNWDDTYFHFEIDALRRVDEMHLTGVTHMLRHYLDDNYEAILKTFAEGTPCNRLDWQSLQFNPEFIAKLDALYMKLHLAGIAKIHFMPRKVVIGDDGELTLVDLSTCIVEKEYGIHRFAQEMLEDSRFINRLERRSRRHARAATA
ncbi:MAG: hypothetical protein KDI19_06170 [Pseudomonadales bacterium]|nr:hypothetical protein [Pseudomonadales bacterium]